MIDALTLFALWLLSGCRSGGSSGTWAPSPAAPSPVDPGGQPGWPGSPVVLPGGGAPPWPQVVPTGLPKFPGPGWEFDEPPPAAVQKRAGQLVTPLWQQGAGAYRIEQTAGRWIAYQAQVVASGKRGVVAYREKRAAPAITTASAPRVPAPARRAPVPQVTPASSPAPAPRVTPPAPAAPAPAVAPSTLRLPTLRRGAGIRPQPPSADVRLLQQRLGIPADGQFGGGTDAAVRAYQARKGLTPDGIVGPNTWAALFASGRA